MKPRYAGGFVLMFYCWLFLSPVSAFANNYCTGKGYIAFDAFDGHPVVTPGLQSAHVLRVFRFGAGRGIYKAGDWPMRNSSVTAMWCNGGHVVVSGPVGVSVEQSTVRDEIDITDNSAMTDSDNEGTASLSEEGDLGYSRPPVVPLDSSDVEHKYQLVTRTSWKGSERTPTVELLQIDSQQNVSQRVLLYEERVIESGD